MIKEPINVQLEKRFKKKKKASFKWTNGVETIFIYLF